MFVQIRTNVELRLKDSFDQCEHLKREMENLKMQQHHEHLKLLDLKQQKEKEIDSLKREIDRLSDQLTEAEKREAK